MNFFFNPYSDKAFKWAKYRVNICKGSLFQSRKLVSKSLSFSLVRGIQNRITIDIHTKYLIDNYILSNNQYCYLSEMYNKFLLPIFFKNLY